MVGSNPSQEITYNSPSEDSTTTAFSFDLVARCKKGSTTFSTAAFSTEQDLEAKLRINIVKRH